MQAVLYRVVHTSQNGVLGRIDDGGGAAKR